MDVSRVQFCQGRNKTDQRSANQQWQEARTGMMPYPQISMDDVFAAALGVLVGICVALIAQQIGRAFKKV